MKVTLKKDHTHAGQPLKAGAQIDVTEAEATWLADHQVIDAPPAGAKRNPAEEK
jgi:hypothetical protein